MNTNGEADPSPLEVHAMPAAEPAASSRDFFTIATRTGTDKVTMHDYHLRYPHYLEPLRLRPVNLLEIGVQDGRSLRLWEEYLPYAHITGLDIEPSCIHRASRRSAVYVGAQQDRALLERLHQERGPFDVVIDDGGHVMAEQQACFQVLFPLLRPRGLYVIEDLETSYRAAWGGGFRKRGSTVEMIKALIDGLNRDYIGPRSSARLRGPARLDGIHLYRNIAFFLKSDD